MGQSGIRNAEGGIMKLKNVLLLYFRIPHSYFRLLLYSMYEAETQASKKTLYYQ
jgi:hypothetical protein